MAGKAGWGKERTIGKMFAIAYVELQLMPCANQHSATVFLLCFVTCNSKLVLPQTPGGFDGRRKVLQ